MSAGAPVVVELPATGVEVSSRAALSDTGRASFGAPFPTVATRGVGDVGSVNENVLPTPKGRSRPRSRHRAAPPAPLPAPGLFQFHPPPAHRGVSLIEVLENSRGSASTGIPTPVSRTITTAPRPDRQAARGRSPTAPPRSVNLSALDNRLSSTFSICSASKLTGVTSAAVKRSAMPRRSASGAKASVAARANSTTSCVRLSRVPPRPPADATGRAPWSRAEKPLPVAEH